MTIKYVFTYQRCRTSLLHRGMEGNIFITVRSLAKLYQFSILKLFQLQQQPCYWCWAYVSTMSNTFGKQIIYHILSSKNYGCFREFILSIAHSLYSIITKQNLDSCFILRKLNAEPLQKCLLYEQTTLVS